MSIIESLRVVFTFNSEEAKKQISDIDTKLDELAKKGKKRDVEEEKRFKELKKEREDTVKQIVRQRQEVDKLNDSFEKMIGNGISAVAGFATFEGFKNALKDVNSMNASLEVAHRLTGLNIQEVRRYSAALASFGGNGPAAEQALIQIAYQRRRAGLPAEDVPTLIKSLSTPVGEQYGLQTGLLPLFGPLTSASAKDRAHALATVGAKAAGALTPQAAEEALKNQAAANNVRQSLENVATDIDRGFGPAVQRFEGAVNYLVSAFGGHPYLAAAAAGATTVGSGLATGAGILWFLKLGKRLFTKKAIEGELAEGGEAAAGGGILSTLGLGALIAAGSAGLVYGSSALGTYIGTKIKEGREGKKTNQQRIYDFWRAQGYSDAAARGWLANAQAESSLNPLARNGSHFGLYQWDPVRRQRIKNGTGIDVATASVDDQLKAAAWEASHFYGLSPSAFSGGAYQAGGLISDKFEVPALTPEGLAREAARRGSLAAGYNLAGFAGGAGTTKNVNIKIDDVNVHTQATDASAISTAVAGELKNQIRTAMSNFDDGVNY